MNQGEKICRDYRKDVRCFEDIPLRFEFNGIVDDDCSFIFPPGYSMYVEEFTLEDPGLDNFVLNGEMKIGYSPRLEWKDRIHSSWKSLDKAHPLFRKAVKRVNRCIRTLKVP